MQVFKFGGASLKDATQIQQTVQIIQQWKGSTPLVVVISAIGKTTNALEKIAETYYAGEKEAALSLFQDLKDFHLKIAQVLLNKNLKDCQQQLTDLFTEVEWLLHDRPVRDYNYYYDQIVCNGELLSSTIVSFTLRENGQNNEWLDVRDVLRTDASFREAVIDWSYSDETINATVRPMLANSGIVLTQGFIGATDENESTTLGREGSDFTAAIFASILGAENVTIWKDVDGVMNADPKLFPDAEPIHHLNYGEVIEMAYYGAQVIHPKTIKPLQNKNIPLLVKCFKDTHLQGTRIDGQPTSNLPTITIVKNQQALIEISSKDFSFISGKPLIDLYSIFQELLIKPNMLQIGAITLQICINDDEKKINSLKAKIENAFSISILKELELTTIRHFDEKSFTDCLTSKQPILIQKDKVVFQYIS